MRRAVQTAAAGVAGSTASPLGCVLQGYNSLVRSGKVRDDIAQRTAAAVLADVQQQVEPYLQRAASVSSWPTFLARARTGPAPRGAYLHGGVGSGKTMLMDMLYDALEADGKHKSHFHNFVLDVHARLHSKRAASPGDKIGEVARDIAREVRLLSLDEFQVTDISDAVIVHHLFKRLFENGVVLLATSNREPERLYENGLQRALFEPVIPLLRKSCVVHRMGDTRDYRLRNVRAAREVFFTEAENGARALQDIFSELAGDFPVREARIDVLGRKLVVPMAVRSKGLAFFTFEELCRRPLSSADYIALCNAFHTICIADIPVLDVISDRNACRRFTKFIDTAYRVATKIVAHAAAPADQLFIRSATQTTDESTGVVQTEEAFESYRTQSRLFEMQTDEYLEQAWRPDGEDIL